jgi:serine/threonine protein kinase
MPKGPLRRGAVDRFVARGRRFCQYGSGASQPESNVAHGARQAQIGAMTDPTEDKPLAARLAEALGDAYTIEGEIGRGGMGVVYRARDERLQRRVAIKVLPPELAFQKDIRQRFTREAQTAARLSHPHIVPIHTVGAENGSSPVSI